MVRCLASPERTLGTSGFMKTGEFSNATFGENAPATHRDTTKLKAADDLKIKEAANGGGPIVDNEQV